MKKWKKWQSLRLYKIVGLLTRYKKNKDKIEDVQLHDKT